MIMKETQIRYILQFPLDELYPTKWVPSNKQANI